MVASSSSVSLLSLLEFPSGGRSNGDGGKEDAQRTERSPHHVKSEEGGTMVKYRSKWVVALAIMAVSLTLSGVAIATGPTGSVVSEVLGAGATEEKFEFRAKPNTNTVVASFTFGPNSSTGWHTHPGRTLVTVKSGTFTVYHAEDCAPLVYEPGDAFVELPTTVHVGRNETTEAVELGVVFFKVPIGGSPRIDQPQPEDCDVT
jgi:quercetin dioxygenase-like cupin family protein